MYSSLNAIARDIHTAYAQTLFVDLKVVDAAIVRQLALRKLDEHRSPLLGPLQSSRASVSSVSISSSYPSSCAMKFSRIGELEGVQKSGPAMHQVMMFILNNVILMLTLFRLMSISVNRINQSIRWLPVTNLI